MKTATTSSTTINSFKRMVVKILRLGNQDVQTSFQVSPFGFDSNPIKDMVAIQSETSIKGETVVIGYIGKEHVTKVGETRLYSTDANGVLKSTVLLTDTGALELLGNDNYAVRYNELETAFNQLKSDFNNFANAYVAGGPTVVGLPVIVVPSTADIAPAKNEDIKTN
mgnify:CR=1 FL=1